ncbi:alpha/beta hydrolase [Roseomonas sp. NAR14]|uniref:Alpha/beta hydrolase n=1 Tax=Roseomonas acroporae TaxID=2937791 RepID=A0A9X1Y7I0_9PROT|nr:alpha/beta hydrolase [Roseomonas acroporae]MCK8784522.1 alpha/beta hydrolase [Roseomonas acroporae]
MPTLRTEDGVDLYYEEAGSGAPMLFVHEFAGDHRSWEGQMRHFARRYRCVAYNARGYPPSAVPTDPEAYSQARAADDVAAVIRGLGLGPTHVVGCSMGAYATLHLGLRHPSLARSLTAVGVGYGSEPSRQAQFRAESQATAARFRNEGMAAVAAVYGRGPTRLAYERNDPRGFAEFLDRLAGHSAEGSALTMLGVQSRRPSLFELEAALRALAVPTLVVAGDEDEPALVPSLFLKRVVPTAALLVMPGCGHTPNLEDPGNFDRALLEFVTRVDAGRWHRPAAPPA